MAAYSPHQAISPRYRNNWRDASTVRGKEEKLEQYKMLYVIAM